MRRTTRTAAGAVLMGAALTLAAWPAVAQDASPVPGLLGATTVVFTDDFSAPGTWEPIADETGVTAYDEEHGVLLMSVTADRATVWDDAELDAATPVMRVEAWVATTGEGMAGVACGSSVGLPRWLWAGTDGLGGWLLGRMIDGRLQVAQRGDLPREVDWEHVTLAIECASDPAAGGDHVVVSADGIPLGSGLDIPVGPYDKATLLVGADVAPEEAQFDDLVVSAGDAYVAPAPGTLPTAAP